MELNDIHLIRTRWNKEDQWRYEVCSDDELHQYMDTKDQYEMCVPRDGWNPRDAEFQVLFSCNANLSYDLYRRITEYELENMGDE